VITITINTKQTASFFEHQNAIARRHIEVESVEFVLGKFTPKFQKSVCKNVILS
jgi:hypothetical protein